MSLTLFDFETVDITEEELRSLFDELRVTFKEARNPYSMSVKEMSSKMRLHLDKFEDYGWITFEYKGRRIDIAEEFIMHYTLEELVESYKNGMEKIIRRTDVSWYETITPYMNNFNIIRYANEELKHEFQVQKNEISIQYAIRLGLEHFYEVPSSRGMKMSPLDSKWQKEYVLPIIVADVLAISDFDEMAEYFKQNVFFCGRRDWNWGRNKGDTAPLPEFKSFNASVFELACLTQAEDEKTVREVFEYLGSSFGGSISKDKTIVYPEGWSYKTYTETLTDEDFKTLKEEARRLERLHGRPIWQLV